MDKAEIIRRKQELEAQSSLLKKSIEEHSAEEQRVIKVLHNAESILNDLDSTFEKRTSLSKTDVSILMVATALKLIRIYLLPQFQERYDEDYRLDHDDEIIKEMEKEEIDAYKKDPKHKKWASVKR